MSDKIYFKCTKCTVALVAPTTDAGKNKNCPDCKTTLTVPYSSTTAPPGATACPQCGREATMIPAGRDAAGTVAKNLYTSGHPIIAAGAVALKVLNMLGVGRKWRCTYAACGHEFYP